MEIAPHDFVIEVNDFDSDAMIQNVLIMESKPIPGHSSQVETVIVSKQEKKSVDHTQKEVKVKCMSKITGKTGRKVCHNRSEEGRQAIVNSNLDLKKGK